MKNLVKKVIKIFLISLIILYVLTVITDDGFDILLKRYPENSREFWALLLTNIFLNFLTLVLTCVIFIKGVSKYFKEEIKRQLDEQHLLYSSITHDLKTPLTSVKGYAKALLDGKVKPEDREETYQTIYRKTEEMNKLFNSLFEYSKLSNENYKPEKVETDVSELVKESVIGSLDLIEKNGINLEVAVEDGVSAEIAPNEMSRVFDNLILNAVLHNDKGINIEVKLKKDHSSWIFSVADSGGRILPEDQKRIFDSFSKLDASRPSSGNSGLGLAIVKRIVEYHKGSVRISEEFAGYTKAFVVEVPIRT